MPPRIKQADKPANLEAALWDSANKLRSNMHPAEYKHVVLGLIFLKNLRVGCVRRSPRTTGSQRTSASQTPLDHQTVVVAIRVPTRPGTGGDRVNPGTSRSHRG